MSETVFFLFFTAEHCGALTAGPIKRASLLRHTDEYSVWQQKL
jgi:hypothetical protein